MYFNSSNFEVKRCLNCEKSQDEFWFVATSNLAYPIDWMVPKTYTPETTAAAVGRVHSQCDPIHHSESVGHGYTHMDVIVPFYGESQDKLIQFVVNLAQSVKRVNDARKVPIEFRLLVTKYPSFDEWLVDSNPSSVMTKLKKRAKQAGIDIGIVPCQTKFSRARAVNALLRSACSSSTCLVGLIDVDEYVGPSLIRHAVAFVHPSTTAYVPIDFAMHHPEAVAQVEEVIEKDVILRSMHTWHDVDYKGMWKKTAFGQVVLAGPDAQVFRMDEDFEGWGGEDNAWFRLLTDHLNVVRIREQGLIHQWHEKDCRVGSSVQPNMAVACLTTVRRVEGSILGAYLRKTRKLLSPMTATQPWQPFFSGFDYPQEFNVYGQKFASTYASLFETNTRYYVYDDPDIALEQFHRPDLILRDPNEWFEHLGNNGMAEIMIIDALKKHPLRTMDPNEADFFFIPISAAAVKNNLFNDPKEQIRTYEKAISALERTATFRETQGHRHVMLSLWFGQFEYRFHDIPKYGDDPMYRFIDRLWNVTIADAKLRDGIEKLYQEGKNPDFQDWLADERVRLTRTSFSIGMLPTRNIALVQASFERFKSATNFIFYHTRPTEFWTPHSTEFRRAAVDEKVIQRLPPSSMGYDIPKPDYEREILRTKFCLVVRGDDPGSHALYRSVKAGCLPVIVSDALPNYCPAMPASLRLEDYSIFIEESKYFKDPAKELSKLKDLPDSLIQDKMNAMKWVQRVILPDHPRSLFVPAFLREAAESIRQAQPYNSASEHIKSRGLSMPKEWASSSRRRKRSQEII